MWEQTKDKNPLVSIIVITYNSANYVVETLESARTQTYQNIELIVSDDCSTDNTVEICREWIEKNRERFVRTELITVEKNTGIPANCNRGVRASQGEWVKLIAGDDLLLPKCIFQNIDYILNNRDAYVVFSNDIIFYENNQVEKSQNLAFFKKSAKRQYVELLKFNPVSIVSMFRKNFKENDSLNYYNEDYRMIEDYPYLIKLTGIGIRLHHLNKITVKKRVHASSVMGQVHEEIRGSQNNYAIKYFDSIQKLYKQEILPAMLKTKLYIYYFSSRISLYIWEKRIENDKYYKLIRLLGIFNLVQYKKIFVKAKNYFLKQK